MAPELQIDLDGLGRVSVFADLARAELETVAARCRWSRHSRGKVVVHADDDTDDVYFVIAGSARAEVFGASGRAVTFRDMEAGDIFGELSAIDGQRRSANVTASTEVTIASLSAQAYRDLLRDHPAVAKATLRRLVMLVRSLSDRVVEFSTLAVRQRVHAELLRLGRRHMVSETAAKVTPAPTHAEIANRISTHREAVSREMSELAREGLIERREGGLYIPDMERLADRADGLAAG